MQAGENPVNNDHYLTMQIFMEQLWAETWHRNGKLERSWMGTIIVDLSDLSNFALLQYQ